jgi:carboxypeptidase T
VGFAASVQGDYLGLADFESRWRELAAKAGARETEAGRSVQGRPLWRFDFGSRDPGAPAVLLTALNHGVEVIGSVTLLDVVARLLADRRIPERARFTVMPIVNPDAFANNMDRLARGHSAHQRKNANGVDLNRNFPIVGDARSSWHPFSGSSYRFMPHYRGPRPLSEPESRAVHDVAMEIRPRLAVGFHSFGNMLLYPWAHCRKANPRLPLYRQLAAGFSGAMGQVPYRCRQAVEFYPTLGDLDDWLDVQVGTLALTVEVGGLDRRLLDPRRLFNVFWWMNPTRILGTVANVSPGVLGLLRAGLNPARPSTVSGLTATKLTVA